MAPVLDQARNFLRGARFAWAVCGGYALNLFTAETWRERGDIDICVFEDDRDAVRRYMLDGGRRVWEFYGQGKMRPMDAFTQSRPGRNLMCIKGDCELARFFGETEGLWYHEFLHTGIKRLNYMEFLFNTAREDRLVFDAARGIERVLFRAIVQRGWGMGCLAPEIALLYRAARAQRPEYQQDFICTYARMDSEQRQWFLQSLNQVCPSGYTWQQMPSAPKARRDCRAIEAGLLIEPDIPAHNASPRPVVAITGRGHFCLEKGLQALRMFINSSPVMVSFS